MRSCRPLLGTFVEIDCDCGEAIDAGFAAIVRVHALMSAHEPDSDVGRINRLGHLGPVEVDHWTMLVLERALAWSKRSAGAFDVVRAGKSAIERGLLPRHADQPMPEASHWTWIEAHGRTVNLVKAGCIDLGGIAKGFAVDRAVAAMRRAGASSGLVNAGGDLFAFGPVRRPVTVVHPRTRRPLVELELRDSALATSALQVEGSGDHLPAGAEWISVSVRAQSACDADALTKLAWARLAGLGDMLGGCGAQAFGIRANGSVEDFATQSLAA